MSFHRVIIVAFATALATGMTSTAFAGCGACGWAPPPVEYAPVPPAPIYPPAPPYAQGPCGGCGYSQAVTYAAEPPVGVAPAPIAVDHWDTGGWGGCGWGGCGHCGGCGSGVTVTYAPIAPSPYYVTSQGPTYSGPGIMVPFGTYSPSAGLSAAGEYPYIGSKRYRSGYGMPYPMHPRYYGPRVYGARIGGSAVYHERVLAHPPAYAPAPNGHINSDPHHADGMHG
jgi:hypothetical protein